jgi:hypothetical protein
VLIGALLGNCLTLNVNAVGSSLSECKMIASLFDNTCSSTTQPIDFKTHVGETISCTGEMHCPGATGSGVFSATNPCTWQRKLCVTCSEINGVTYVRSQTNTLPNHCFNTVTANPIEAETDWQVIFNRDVAKTLNYPANSVDTPAEVSDVLCNREITDVTKMLAGNHFVNNMVPTESTTSEMPTGEKMLASRLAQRSNIETRHQNLKTQVMDKVVNKIGVEKVYFDDTVPEEADEAQMME